MNFARHALWLFGILVILTDPLLAAEYIGKVVGISDGDTLTLLVPDGDSDNCPVTCRWFYAPYAITF